jgi:hypothetical protein
MSVRYPKEVHEFIRANVEGRSERELTDLVNEKFGLGFTVEKIHAYKHNHKLRSGTSRGKKGRWTVYSPEIQRYIAEHITGTHYADLADMVNREFGTEFKHTQIRAYAKNHKLTNGLDCRFQKGTTPPNKGKKGTHTPGCEKGWFRKGERPVNVAKVGEERYRPKDGYVWMKVAEPNIWRMKHRVVWEEAYGKIPADMIVTFLDGDTTNTELSNLKLISRRVNQTLNKKGMRFDNPEYTEAAINVIQLMHKTIDTKKGKRGGKNESIKKDAV